MQSQNVAKAGLKVGQTGLNVIADNIANLNTPNYIERKANLASRPLDKSFGGGVELKSITRNLDPQIMASLQAQASSASNFDTLNDYYHKIQNFFGTITGGDSIVNNISDFLASLDTLVNNPESMSSKSAVLDAAQMLTTNINNLAKNLQQLRYEADQSMDSAVTEINTSLKALYENNIALGSTYTNNTPNADLMEKQDALIRSIAKHMNISYFTDEKGASSIITSNGGLLLDANHQYFQLSYHKVPSAEYCNNYYSFASLAIFSVNDQGALHHQVQELISQGRSQVAGTPSTVVNNLTNGDLYAFEQLRDVLIPQTLDQLDNFTNTLVKQVNAIHNSGSGYPPSSVLTGTRVISGDDVHYFSGKSRIALLDEKGGAILRPDGSPLPPLTLDLEHLKSSNAFGVVDNNTIINEINQYFFHDAKQNRASLGNIYDIKLAATSNFSTTPAGSISFDLSLENVSQSAAGVQILAVDVSGGAIGLTSSLPNVINVAAGSRIRSNQSFSIDFANASNAPYTVALTVQVTDALGQVSSGVINYTIDDNPSINKVQNTRYAPSSAGGGAIMHFNTNAQGLARASIVDENGNDSARGFLQIAPINSNYTMAIDDLTSTELGSPANVTTLAIEASNKGFSGYFELNDFFLRNSLNKPYSNEASLYNTALNLKIRPSLLANPSLLSVGKLSPSSAIMSSTTKGLSAANGTVTFSSNPQVGDTVTIASKVFTFVASASADNEVSIGNIINNTVDNLTAKLNALNTYTSGGVNNATYSSDGAATLKIVYNSLGVAGNVFTVAGNFASAGVSLNNTAFTTTPSGTLLAGDQEIVMSNVNPWTYEIAIGSNEGVIALAELRKTTFDFNKAGELAAINSSIGAYFNSILSFNTSKTHNYENYAQSQNAILNGYIKNIEDQGGVDLDEQLALSLTLNRYYQANAKMLNISDRLLDYLFENIGGR
jgi:flagellar hook-associated protein 1